MFKEIALKTTRSDIRDHLILSLRNQGVKFSQEEDDAIGEFYSEDSKKIHHHRKINDKK
jgi:hypothetical protein